MGFLQRLKEGLKKTSDKLVHEIKRIVTGSPKLTASTIEELEAALLGADFGVPMTTQIITAVRKAYESQGGKGLDVTHIAAQEVEKSLGEGHRGIKTQASGVTVISIVGVNGTGKTTTTAKLAKRFHDEGHLVVMAACDTFRAAAIEQLKLWGTRLNAPVIAGAYNSDPAAAAHDAVTAATSRNAKYLLVDTAGRLHTKNNLMKELQKVHRVIEKQMPKAPHEVLLVLDATTGMNALNQAKEFHKAVNLTGLVITKLDGTSKGGMVVAIQKELGIPVKFIGVGEQADDLQPFDPKEFAKALFGE
ncbi:MAG: signal recognition particle-docking protein FtsY [Verrucomicrobiota bacterium]